MTNHMQSKSLFIETHQIFYSSCSERSFWIHTVNVAESVGREEIVVSFGISHLKVVEEYAFAFPSGGGDNMITF